MQVGSDGSSWVPGFFDRDSYQEYLSGWGKSVVVGRARIGGIPMGVINVETRLSEQVQTDLGCCDCCWVVVVVLWRRYLYCCWCWCWRPLCAGAASVFMLDCVERTGVRGF